MREVRHSGDWLPEALRDLGADSRRHAPAHVGAALKDAFVRRHAARRRTQKIRLAAMSAIVVLAAGISLLMRGPRPDRQTAINHDRPSQTRIGTALAISAPPETALTASRRQPQTVTTVPAEDRFVALPSYDSHMTNEELRVVRLQLSGEELRRVGVPVQEENSERILLADFVVGQDGTPYAFRLVSP
jgi:hypothetical protein